jgi:hypothetical protein
MRYRSVRILSSWCVGLIVWSGGAGMSTAQERPTREVPIEAVPAELRTWVAQLAPSWTSGGIQTGTDGFG